MVLLFNKYCLVWYYKDTEMGHPMIIKLALLLNWLQTSFHGMHSFRNLFNFVYQIKFKELASF